MAVKFLTFVLAIECTIAFFGAIYGAYLNYEAGYIFIAIICGLLDIVIAAAATIFWIIFFKS